ncbi:MAG: hemerythrin domain-containing protein [Candidatus Sumerlaeaceae bacterium]|nr:hemerythrin domain-containing protein [Candidatus Sumerlaeaceae bacterium]
MTMPLHLTLSELAKSQPNIAHAVATLGLEPHVYAKFTLNEALEQLALPPSTDVLFRHAALWCIPCDVCWPTTSIGEIIAHVLEQHHRFLRQELPRLQLLLHRAANRDMVRTIFPANTLLETFVGLKAEIDVHLLKEEEVLFPLAQEIERAVRPLGIHCQSVRNPIGVMMVEHENAKSALAEIRSITQDFTPPAESFPLVDAIYAALRQLEADLLAHIREEDDILFPRLIALEDELFGR